jgi:hypothetical protein
MNEHIALIRKAKLSWMYPIYVPSYSRAGSAPLLEMLHTARESIQKKVHIVVRPEEKLAYEQAYPWATVIPEKQPGIGPARMRCLLHAEIKGYKNIVVLDDDIIHVSLLERVARPGKSPHTRRYSAKVSEIPEPDLLVLSLAVACRMASVLFKMLPTVAYGAARNALFSGDVDTSVGATLNKGSFPACVMFFNVYRFSMRQMPKPYHFHGEDLAMFLDTLEHKQHTFTLPGVAYDQHGSIDSTIPLDPQSEVGRPHLLTTEKHYPNVHPFLRVSMKNKLGGTMRIGVNWIQWYKSTGTAPVEIPLDIMIKEIK